MPASSEHGTVAELSTPLAVAPADVREVGHGRSRMMAIEEAEEEDAEGEKSLL